MRISRALTAAALIMVFALMASEAAAEGGNKEGTAAADQLLVPVGARGIALGGSYSSGLTGIEAIYYNPAGLSGMARSVEVAFSQLSYFGQDGVSYLALGTSFGSFGSLALTVKTFSFGDILMTDERQPDGTGATFSPNYMTLGLTYSRALTDRIRAGVSVYFISEQLDRASTSGTAFDVGVQYAGLGGVEGLELGVTLKHLGGNMNYDGPGLLREVNEVDGDRTNQWLSIEAAGYQMPTSLEIGLAYTRQIAEDHALMFATSFENSNFLTDQYRLGLEYSFSEMLFLRGAYTITDKVTDQFGDDANIFGPSFGAGVQKNIGAVKLAVDYAYRTVTTFSGQHVFTLYVGF